MWGDVGRCREMLGEAEGVLVQGRLRVRAHPNPNPRPNPSPEPKPDLVQVLGLVHE